MQVLVVPIAGRRFAIDCAEVVELLPVVGHRPAGTGPAWLLGLFNLRGALVPLVDLSRIVASTPTEARLGSRIAVLRLEGDLFRSAPSLVGLLVPEVAEMTDVDFDVAGAHPGFAFAGASHLGPTAIDGEGPVQLLRCRRILEGDAALRELPATMEHGG